MFSRELRLRNALKEIEGEYDVAFVDCPPSLGLLTVNALAGARRGAHPDPVRVLRIGGSDPIAPQRRSGSAQPQSGLEVEGVLLTMFDARTRLAADVAAQVRAHFGERTYRAVDTSDGAALRGAIVRGADRGIRPDEPRRHRLSGTCPGVPPAAPAGRGGAVSPLRRSGLGRGLESLIPVGPLDSRACRTSASTPSVPTRNSPVGVLPTTPSIRWRRVSPRSGSCSQSWCGPTERTAS